MKSTEKRLNSIEPGNFVRPEGMSDEEYVHPTTYPAVVHGKRFSTKVTSRRCSVP